MSVTVTLIRNAMTVRETQIILTAQEWAPREENEPIIGRINQTPNGGPDSLKVLGKPLIGIAIVYANENCQFDSKFQFDTSNLSNFKKFKSQVLDNIVCIEFRQCLAHRYSQRSKTSEAKMD